MVKNPAPAASPAVDPAMLAAIVQALAAAGVAPVGAQSASPAPAAKGKGRKAKAPAGPVTASTRPGKREGFVEVVFSAKPEDAIREALKGASYRWAHSTACWYGLEAALPAAVASMVGGAK